MCAMAVDSLVRCRVSAETKALLLGIAARENLTESALVRQLIETMVRTSAQDSNIGPPEREVRGERMSVRLAPDDRQLLAERSSSRGMPAATYVAVLVRSHLRKLTPMPPQELAALKRCIAELAAITGQIRLANRGATTDSARKDFTAMLRVCQTLWDTIKRMLKDNQDSWERGYAEKLRAE